MFRVPFHKIDLGRPGPGNFLLCSAEWLYVLALVPQNTHENRTFTQSLKEQEVSPRPPGSEKNAYHAVSI